MSTVLTLQKLKDDDSNVKFKAHLSRVVIGQDEDGDDISTLVVDRVEDGAGIASKSVPKSIPRAQRLLMDVVDAAIEEIGESFRPFGESGPIVRGVYEKAIRIRYYARMAESAAPGEEKETLLERQRKAFGRAIGKTLEAKALFACERNEERFVWLP
jgi:hypothetical protein